MLAAGLAGHTALVAPRLGALPLVLGGAGWLLLAAAVVFRQGAAVGLALVLIGGAYAALFFLRGAEVDTRAPLYAAGLFAVGELAFSATELRVAPPETGLLLRRAVVLTAASVGTIALGAVVLAAAALPLGGGLGLEAVGVAAAVTAVALVARAASS